jgi:hypothetical protein
MCSVVIVQTVIRQLPMDEAVVTDPNSETIVCRHEISNTARDGSAFRILEHWAVQRDYCAGATVECTKP